MSNFIANFEFDFWTLWGITAQALFFSRFIIQWYLSEKEGKVVIPKIFWVISLIGSLMVLTYALVRRDFVFLVTGVLQIILYSRNLMLNC